MKTAFTLAAILILASQAHAVTIDTAIGKYLGSSPQLSSQAALRDLSKGDRWRRFFPKEPQAQFTNADDSSTFSYGLSLTTSFPGKAIAFSAADRAKYEGDEAELRAKRHELMKFVAGSYMDCASGQATVDLQEQAVDDFSTLARLLQTLYESGHSTQAERIGAQLQSRQAAADLEAARSKSEGACRKWSEIMRDQDLDPKPEALPDDLKPETLAAIGIETSDQARAKSVAKIAEVSGRLRWWAQAPDLTFGVTRNRYAYAPASPAGHDWTTNFTVAVTLPLLFPFAESVEARRTAAQSVLDQDVARIQLNTANADREAAAKEFQRSQRRLVELREKDLPLAEALVESTLAAYRSGKLGFAELILSRKTLIDLKTQEIQLRSSSVDARLRCLQDCTPSTTPAPASTLNRKTS